MPNDNQNPLYAYAEARIAAWQAVLASLRSALALDPGGQTVEGMELPMTSLQNGEFGQPMDLPEGAFNGKSLPACVKLFLSAAKRKKTLKEIATALRDGGVESTSDDFENVVNGAIARLKKAGEVLRFKDGWGLPEWYPANIRASAPAVSSKRTRKRGKRNRTNTAAKTPTASDRIIELLRAKPEREFSPEEIAEDIGVGVQVARLILGTLRKSGKVKISAPGMYSIGRPQLVAAGA